MSYFNTWLLLASALISPEGQFLKHGKWKPYNAEQKYIIKNLTTFRSDLQKYTSTEMEALSSKDHEALNTMAHMHNIPLMFKPFGPGEFGSLAVLDVALNWPHKTEATETLFSSSECKKSVPVKALQFIEDFEVYHVRKYTHPIVKIKTKSGDTVWVTLADAHVSHKALSKKIQKLRKCIPSATRKNYDSFVMPYIAYEGMIDISWMKKLTYVSKHEPYAVADAVEYLKLFCDPEGCSVKAGAGLQFELINTSKTITINKPFYFWIERPGTKFPLVEAYIDIDSLIMEKEVSPSI